MWVSDQPLDERAEVNRLFEVVIDQKKISQYEWIEEGKGYREWLVPADLLNRFGSVRLLSGEEESELFGELLQFS